MTQLEDFFRAVYRIRLVEEEVARVYWTDVIKSPVHLSIGQEAIAVGVCEALQPDDIVFSSYRSHAAYLAKGGDLNAMVAELYGKQTGCAKGKGGSMHLADSAQGVMGASAVVGTTLANSIGYAYALKYQRSDRVVVSFFGDGATDEGVFYESMNWAALKQLPIIFICENNGYAIHTRQQQRQSNPDIAGKARSFGVTAECIDNGNVFTIYEQVAAAVEALRKGQPGPYFFECRTYRMKEHVGPSEDWKMGYRSADEAAPWMETDVVKVLGEQLHPATRAAIEAEVQTEVQAAFEFAENSPFPPAEELYTDQWA